MGRVTSEIEVVMPSYGEGNLPIPPASLMFA